MVHGATSREPRPVIGFSWTHYNASYLYDYGDGSWSSDLPSEKTTQSYISYIRTLFNNSGSVWTSSQWERYSDDDEYFEYVSFVFERNTFVSDFRGNLLKHRTKTANL